MSSSRIGTLALRQISTSCARHSSGKVAPLGLERLEVTTTSLGLGVARMAFSHRFGSGSCPTAVGTGRNLTPAAPNSSSKP